MITESLANLESPDWVNHISYVEKSLKAELQTQAGFLRKLKEESEKTRKHQIDSLLAAFYNSGTDLLDERVDTFTSTIYRINQNAQISLQYDLLNTIKTNPAVHAYPCLNDAKTLLLADSTSKLLHERIAAVLFKISNQTLSQSNKSNAGVAGELFARAILSSVGLQPNKHYREQYQSDTGSDTDIAFPNIKDREDAKLEVLVAIQISTNDRARLTSSELKKGVVGYVVTGNGLKASTKALKDIGTQIISGYRENNIRLVCHRDEIQIELDRITSLIKTSPNRNELLTRKKYFEESAFSFSDFADKMSRFLTIQRGAKTL